MSEERESRRYVHLHDRDAAAMFERIYRACAARDHAGPPVVVLDLDGTLMDNRPRTVAILHDLAARWRARHPAAAETLAKVRAESLAYLLSDSLRAVGIVEPALVAEATEYWRSRFFADADLTLDVALAGSVEFVTRCHALGATVVYLTGRDLPMMGLGTFASLRTLGFPLGVAGVEIILKPDANMADEAFKRMVAPTLARIGPVIASFDNEPANCNLFKEAFPAAEIGLLDTQHVPGAPAPRSDVAIVPDFRAAIRVGDGASGS
jgi:hypothetical protein